MPISFVGSGSVLNSTSGSSTAVPMPTGLLANQMVYVLVANVGNSPTATAPVGGGWTAVASFSPGTTLSTYLYRKVAVSGDVGATPTWSWSSSGRNLGVSLAYAGVDSGVATSTTQVWTHDVANASITAGALTAAAGDWLVTVGVGRENPGTATTKDWSVQTGTDAQRLDIATGGLSTDIKLSLGWFDSAGGVFAGSTARTVDVTPVQQQSHVWSILLNQLAGGNPWTHMGRPLN